MTQRNFDGFIDESAQSEHAAEEVNVLAQTTVATVLAAIFVRHRKLNPSLTVSAWARSLRLGSRSHMSRILNGKRKVTLKSADRFAGVLGLAEQERLHLIALARSEWDSVTLNPVESVRGTQQVSEVQQESRLS